MTENNPSLTESTEDYLEIIYELEREYRIAHVKDIAEKMGVKMASVSNALAKLSELGLVDYGKYRHVTLTARGKNIAGKIHSTHAILKSFLKNQLAVGEELAEKEACKLEHAMSRETIEKLIRFIHRIEADKKPSNGLRIRQSQET